jgi:hypothetical protein
MPKQLNHLKEKIMKDLRKAWKLIALFVCVVIGCLFYVGRSKAFAKATHEDPITVTIESGSDVSGPNQWILKKIINELNGFGLSMDIQVIDTNGNPVGSPNTIHVGPGATGDDSFAPTSPGATETIPPTGEAVVVPAETRFQYTLTYPADAKGVVEIDTYVMNPDGTGEFIDSVKTFAPEPLPK